mmetsp:Transcript_19023/g.21876  ORF Transcript_19023/g.21876 Transcript_19023/m.21876 type:complete len:90 (+) Transcript_19023:367-636(+)
MLHFFSPVSVDDMILYVRLFLQQSSNSKQERTCCVGTFRFSSTVRHGVYGIELYCIVDVIVLSVLCVSTIALIVGSGWDEQSKAKQTNP